MMSSLDDEHAVHVRVELRRAALCGAIKVVAAWRVDLERHRERRAHHRTVDEHVLIETVEREAVAGPEPVVGRREFDLHDLPAAAADLGWLVLPGVLAELNHAVGSADALHAPRQLPLLIS